MTGRQLDFYNLPETEQVVKANALVMGQIDWTLWEYRVFISHVAQLKKDDRTFEDIAVSIRELADAAGVKSKSLYERGKKIAERLTDKKIRVEDRLENGSRRYSAVNVYSSCQYLEDGGVIKGRFTEEMRPYLLQLKERFTRYARGYALPLRSIYSMRFYEILKSYEYREHFRMTIDQLRTVFNLQDKYERFADLRRRVIDRAQEELGESDADVTFEYEVVRDGRSPVAIDFWVQPNGAGAKTLDAPKPGHAPPQVNGSERAPDAIERAFDDLPAGEQKAIRKEARGRVLEDRPDAQGVVLQVEAWKRVRQIMRERHLESE